MILPSNSAGKYRRQICGFRQRRPAALDQLPPELWWAEMHNVATPIPTNRHSDCARPAEPGRDKTSTAAVAAERFIRERECKERTGLSRTMRWRLERASKFPKRRKISDGTVGWLLSEIDAWIATKAAA
jgi:prophage regulatory protein